MSKKTVYVGMTVDVLHTGHINIIRKASEYGEVKIGLLTDSALVEHKRLPYLSWDQRREIVENIVGVSEVVPQNEWNYAINVKKYQPDYMVHGDDWKLGPESKIREQTLAALDEYGGKLIETAYTKGISSGAILADSLKMGSTPDLRRRTLRRLLNAKSLCRIIEAHSPLSALIGESVSERIGGKTIEFDGFWSSSLTDSTLMGKPDIEALEISTRLLNINNIFEVTSKPLIMDVDTGGKLEHFELHVRSMERLGISAAIVEDKTGLKKNSLFGTEVPQEQEKIEIFADKIRAGRAALLSEDFMIIARIESLILERGMEDAMTRARAYIDAGAHGVMIHSRRQEPDEVYEFGRLFRIEFPNVPLVAVPTSYNHVREADLEAHGFNIVIYANHMLRAAYPAMKRVAQGILHNSRSLESDDEIISINEILELIPGTK